MTNEQIKSVIKHEIIKCSQDPIYFMRTYCYIRHPQRGKIKFDLYPFQEKLLVDLKENRFNIILKSRQLGISTLSAGFSLWDMLFTSDYQIEVIATKEKVAKAISTKVRLMYELLPSWFKTKELETDAIINNQHTLTLRNNSQIVASTCTPDSGRSASLNLLIIDECISYESMITIRNKIMDYMLFVPIGFLYHKSKYNHNKVIDNSTKKISDWEVLTPNGWSDFDGIKKTSKNKYIKLSYSDTSLKCSYSHKMKMLDGTFQYADNIQIGDTLFDGHIILDKQYIDNDIELYDLLNVAKENEYYANNSVQHNCAFIPESIVTELWSGAFPTLSTGGGAIILSTPNGTGGFYHRMWEKAISGESNFHPTILHWTVHPERNQTWRDEQDKELGIDLARQECDTSFLTSGNTVIPSDDIIKYNNIVAEPVEKRGQNKEMWLWEYPDYSKDYIVDADVSRGDGKDYSTFQILDATTLTQCAEFKAKIGTTEFGKLLVATAIEWNNAVLVIENNNMGWAVVQVAIDMEYPNLFYGKKDITVFDSNSYSSNRNIDYTDTDKLVPGFTMTTKVRPLLIEKLRMYMESGEVGIRSSRLMAEIAVFVYNTKGKAEARSGFNDDLIMAFITALWIRDTAIKLRQENIDMWNKTVSNIKVIKPLYSNKSQVQRQMFQHRVGKHIIDLTEFMK